MKTKMNLQIPRTAKNFLTAKNMFYAANSIVVLIDVRIYLYNLKELNVTKIYKTESIIHAHVGL